MPNIKTTSIDTSTICPGKGSGVILPVLPKGTMVTVRVGERVVTFATGYSTPSQLCTQKGQGLPLHNLLAGASRATPVVVTISYED